MAHTEAGQHNHGFTNKAAEGTRSRRTLWAVIALVMFLAMVAAIYYSNFNAQGLYQPAPPSMDNNRPSQP